MSTAVVNLLPSMKPMRILPLTTILLLALSSSQAVAQDDGVFYDTDDSAGKEYAIPTEDARRGATAGKAEPREKDGSAPLFGAGVSKAEETRSSRKGTAGRADRRSDSTQAASPGERVAGASRTPEPRGPRSGTADGGTSGATWSFAFALAVLLAGASVALIVRRTRGLPDPEPTR